METPHGYSILHVAETLKGGIASYLNEILTAQPDQTVRARIMLLAPADQVQELRLPASVQLMTFKASRRRAQRAVEIAVALRKIVRAQQPDIIHAHSSFAGIAVRIAAKLWHWRSRIVYCAHGWAFDREGSAQLNALIALAELGLAYWCDAVICISQHDYRSALARRLPAEKLVLIPNAIAREVAIGKLPEWPSSRHRFLFVGRLDRQKGADIFIETMRRLHDRACAYVIGDTVVSEQKQLQLPDNVFAKGWLTREAVQAYLHSADVVVVPSRWEGFGLIALEAMRAGKPVIASGVGGLAELVIDGMSGRLIKPGDVDALEAAMREACDHDWSQWGEAGRVRFLQNYTAERLQRDLTNLYVKLLLSEHVAIIEQKT